MLIELTVIGNLGRNAEVRTFSDNSTVISFSVASNKTWKDKNGIKQEKTTWINCSWFTDKTTIAQYLVSGTAVYIKGEPRVNAWLKDDKALGSLELVVNKLILLPGTKTNTAGEQPTAETAAAPATATAAAAGIAVDDDDLPF